MASPLLDPIAERFESAPGAPLVVCGAAVAKTCGEMGRDVSRLAGALRDRGVGLGDRVSVQVGKRTEVLTLYLATLWAGAVFHPMNPAYTREESDFMIADAAPAVAVRSDADLDALLGEASAAGPLDEPCRRGPDDLAALLYTSGTTGRPKGAMITHGNLASNAAALVQAWGFGPDDALLHVLPVFHAHGLFVACNTALLSGMPIVWHDRFDADAAIAAMAGTDGSPVRPTIFMGVPTHYVRLLASPRLDRRTVGSMRLLISGSAPLPPQVYEQFARRSGQQILERYGMTETQMITSNPLCGERVAGTVGFPLPGVEVRVVGDGGEPLPAGQTGHVEVRGPSVCAGYWNQPERRSVDFSPSGWFRTGDLGSQASDGRLSLAGRAKDLIISGGYNVYPAELERLLDAVAGVAESAVVGMPHPDLGECGLAVVVLEPGQQSLDPADLLAALEQHVARFKLPRMVVFAPSLPRNAMGKVQKDALRATFTREWEAQVSGRATAG